jgi:hypothetical protein
MKNITISRRLYCLLRPAEHFYIKENPYYGYVSDMEDVDDYENVVVKTSRSIAGNFFDLRNGEISFHPKPENQKIEHGIWKREGRQLIKIGKLIQSLNIVFFDDNNNKKIPQTDELYYKLLIRYSEIITAKVNSDKLSDEIKISNDPSGIYTMKLFGSDLGSLNNSCMRNTSAHSCKKGACMYNKFGAKIAYIERNDCLYARALVWENVKVKETEKTFTFMDRIYGNEATIAYLIEFAEKNEWLHKIEQNSYSQEVTNGNDQYTIDCVSLPQQLVIIDDDVYKPYMDTFNYIADKKVLLAINKENRISCITMRSSYCLTEHLQENMGVFELSDGYGYVEEEEIEEEEIEEEEIEEEEIEEEEIEEEEIAMA